MATIRERTLRDGQKSYTVQIVRRKHDFKENRTFRSRKEAEAFARKVEANVDKAIALGKRPVKATRKRSTLGDAITRSLEETENNIGRTKAQVLRTILNEYDIAKMACSDIKSEHVVAFVKQLSARPVDKSTAGNYLSHLRAVFAIAKPAWGFELDPAAATGASKVCYKFKLVGKSRKRDRRPTMDELDRLMELFAQKHAARPSSIPMHRVTAFAIFSTRRQSEICSLRWKDRRTPTIEKATFPHARDEVLVRAMKHPGDKVGNDVWVRLHDRAAAIMDAMPRIADRPFPYHPDSVCAAFTRACEELEIEDLHFHDLRHEGISWLSETGFQTKELRCFSGHRTQTSLERYDKFQGRGDAYADWRWLSLVTMPMEPYVRPVRATPKRVIKLKRKARA